MNFELVVEFCEDPGAICSSGFRNLLEMAAAACQMMSLKVAQSPRVALDNQAMRGCKAALSSASLGCSRGVVYTLGARLRAVGGDSWGYKSSCCRKFVVSAAVAEPASAIQAESGAPAEGLSMHFKVVHPCRFAFVRFLSQ